MTKVEELRMDIVGSSRDINPHERVDCLIIALQHLMETRCKEALAAQSEAWAKECSRQVASAVEMGHVEGAQREHDRLFGVIQSACCYPIDGDKLFALPICYGDALPIKEPPCSG